MKRKILFIWFLMMILFSADGQSEGYFIDQINTHFQGQKEYRVENGRIDILTSEYAIEVEWARNWKHSLGQALWYAMQSNRKPGIILIMKTLEDRKHGIRLQSAINYAGLQDRINVWFYPEDFGSDFKEVQDEAIKYKKDLISTYGNYTRNRKSGVRHNSRCTYYDCKNCVPCGPTDGKRACGKCGG